MVNLLTWIDRHPARAGTLAGWYQQACSLIAAVVAVPLVIRLLPPSEAGLWFAFQSMLGILQLTDFGFTLVLSRQVAFSLGSQASHSNSKTDFLNTRPGWDGISDVYTLCRHLFRWISLLGLVVLIVLYHLVFPMGKMADSLGTTSMWAWYLMGTAALLQVQAKPHQSLLDGMGKVYLTRFFAGSCQLLTGIGVIVALLVNGSLVSMAAVTFLCYAAIYLALKGYVSHIGCITRPSPQAASMEALKSFAKVSFPMGILGASAFMVLSIQVPIVAFLLGTTAVPAFYLAQRIITTLNQASLQMLFPQLPLFTRQIAAHDFQHAAKRMTLLIGLISMLALCVNLIFFVGSPFLVKWWVGEGRYLPTLVLFVLAVDACLMSCAGLWGQFILASGTNPFAWSTLICGCLNLFLCVVLVGQMGIIGVALASLIAGLLTNYWFCPLKGFQLMTALRRGTC
jgi:O-antigen/teichoic acid export membrane protein